MNNDDKDLEVLRREYRNMELNRKSFAEESKSILKKQQQTLEKLRGENETLKMDIATLQARTTMKPLNDFEQSQLHKVALDIEKYRDSIVKEKAKIDKMSKRISVLRDQIWNHRQRVGGTNASADNQKNIEKQVRILENRLDQALVKFNKSLAKNRKLRTEIDDLRGEKVTFETVHKKLEKNLQERKKKMAKVIEQSNQAYEQRDKSRLEIEAIEQLNRKEQDQFDRQMEEMGKMLEEEINAAAEKRKIISLNTTPSKDETKAASEKAAKVNALLREKQIISQQKKVKIRNFEDAFHRMTVSTGIPNVSELVSKIVNNDSQNFSMFNYANEQANEIKSLIEQIEHMKSEKVSCRQDTGLDLSNNYERIVREIDEKIKATEKQAEKFEQKSADNQVLLDNLRDGIKIMIKRLDCDSDNDEELSVNESNIVPLLGKIEERTNKILQEYCKVKDSCNRELGRDTVDSDHRSGNKSVKIMSVLGSGPQQPMSTHHVSVNPPRLNDYSSDENSGDDENVGSSRPLTRDELKAKTIMRINQPRRNKSNPDKVDPKRISLVRSRRSSLLLGEYSRKALTTGDNV